MAEESVRGGGLLLALGKGVDVERRLCFLVFEAGDLGTCIRGDGRGYDVIV